MKSWYKAFVLLSILPLILLAAQQDNAARGKEIFAKRCALCHGASGEGKEAMAKAFGVVIPVLGSKEVQSLSDGALKKVILEGKGKMRPVTLADQEVSEAIAFLRALKK
jgi:mono/diheme cytochrome c family protein